MGSPSSINEVFKDLEKICSIEAIAISAQPSDMTISLLQVDEAVLEFEVVPILRLHYVYTCQLRYEWHRVFNLFLNLVLEIFIEFDLLLHLIDFLLSHGFATLTLLHFIEF